MGCSLLHRDSRAILFFSRGGERHREEVVSFCDSAEATQELAPSECRVPARYASCCLPHAGTAVSSAAWRLRLRCGCAGEEEEGIVQTQTLRCNTVACICAAALFVFQETVIAQVRFGIASSKIPPVRL